MKPETTEDLKSVRHALEFYANPEVYKPDSVGRRDDITFVARNAINSLDRLEKSSEIHTILIDPFKTDADKIVFIKRLFGIPAELEQ